MTSAKTLSTQSLSDLIDLEILDADTPQLIRCLVGTDAESRYRESRSLWQLLEERSTPGLHWLELERLDLLNELVKRLGKEPRRPAARPIDSPTKAAALFSHLAFLDHEELWIACLNTKNIPIGLVQIAIGSVNSVMASPSRIFREALLRNATGILVAHNHPSGEPTPSSADRAFAKRLREAEPYVGVNVVDSLVIGAEGRAYSIGQNSEV
jgi:DNA repair protein RadC